MASEGLYQIAVGDITFRGKSIKFSNMFGEIIKSNDFVPKKGKWGVLVYSLNEKNKDYPYKLIMTNVDSLKSNEAINKLSFYLPVKFGILLIAEAPEHDKLSNIDNPEAIKAYHDLKKSKAIILKNGIIISSGPTGYYYNSLEIYETVTGVIISIVLYMNTWHYRKPENSLYLSLFTKIDKKGGVRKRRTIKILDKDPFK